DIVLDLEENDTWHNRLFFEALVEAEAPRLTDDFKDQLFTVTEGHPLFTVELLRYLQNEHYLVRDEQGAWLHEKQIRFDSLPSRIDAVISQRISRLDPQLQEILRVAAVEGERFTAQVVAKTLNIDERSLLRHLTHLAQQHKLVREYSHERIEQHYLNRYQFQHTLFPQYLYGSLGDGERRLLHHTVAQHIESLAGHQADRFAMTLAYHYGEADDAAKTATYHEIAGDQSRQASALPEAVRHYDMALAVWPADDPAGRAAVLCKQADCMRTLGQQANALRLLEEAFTLFTAIGNTIRAGDILRRSGRLYWELGESSTGETYYYRALDLLESCPESVELAEAISAIGRMHMLASDNEQAVSWCRRATALAERLGAEPVVIHANNALGPALVGLNQVEPGLTLLRQNIERARTLKLHYEVCCGYINLDGMLKLVGQNEARPELLDAFLDYAREVHAVHYVSCALIQLSEAAWFTGRWRTALHYYQEIEAWGREYPLAPVGKIWVDTLSGMIYNDLNQPQRAYDILMEELERVRNIDEMLITLPLLGQMARATAALGRSAETLSLIREMVALFDRTPAAEGTELLLIVHHWLLEQPVAEAQALAAKIRSYLELFDRTLEIPLATTIWREAQGTAALQEHDIDKAITCFQQAAAGWASLKRPYNHLRTLNFLRQTWQEAGDVDQAQSIFAQLLAIGETLAEQIENIEFKTSFLKSLPKR
ncbi:MAG: hypothetical protein KDI79_19890, partial [Anaerolineae bacterium]|nr:hypothetical protein [Anaerolineae bacterium]